MHMSNAILIREPFASAAQTAKILGVSKTRKQQLLKMLRVNKSKNQPSKFVAHKKIKTPKETNWSMSARFCRKACESAWSAEGLKEKPCLEEDAFVERLDVPLTFSSTSLTTTDLRDSTLLTFLA
jgi:hypothetical protein